MWPPAHQANISNAVRSFPILRHFSSISYNELLFFFFPTGPQHNTEASVCVHQPKWACYVLFTVCSMPIDGPVFFYYFHLNKTTGALYSSPYWMTPCIVVPVSLCQPTTHIWPLPPHTHSHHVLCKCFVTGPFHERLLGSSIWTVPNQVVSLNSKKTLFVCVHFRVCVCSIRTIFCVSAFIG